MEILYVSKGTENYLDVRLGLREEICRGGKLYMVRMLQENDIAFLVRPVVTRADEVISLRHNVTSLYVLKRLFQSMKPDGELLRLMLEQLHQCISEAEEHMLNPDDLVINPEYILYDQSKKNIRLICAPGYNVPIKHQLKTLIEYLMKIFDYRDREGISLLYGLYDRCTEDAVGIKQLLACFDSYENYGREDNFMELLSTPYVNEREDRKTFCPRLIKEGVAIGIAVMLAGIRLLYYGRTERDIFMFICVCVAAIGVITCRILFSDRQADTEEEREGPTDLKEDAGNGITEPAADWRYQNTDKKVNCLLPITNGELEELQIHNGKSRVIIGRDKEDADYQLPTSQISRVHACIEKNGEQTYITDMNSTNGTFVNSSRIFPMQQHIIQKGDIIRIANEEFYCK